ncbi:hypothetical protein P167DRAFT_580874 [Morchella conica CCBAS932]|uniref:Uncharacterized protein n=2 Tax=Morchella sect. Distantes TaxID=1051054 RepID=A0A3N4K6T6_9PEZI|nr:hypothetical protein [Morchella importuna]QGN66648.1 hypothetical protein [Morchella importuna]RPB06256.1 hypothetical protein P167DRAFT_580874 [Morchella conica CCBAS932]
MSTLRLPYTGLYSLPTLQFGDDGRPRLYGDLPRNPPATRDHSTIKGTWTPICRQRRWLKKGKEGRSLASFYTTKAASSLQPTTPPLIQLLHAALVVVGRSGGPRGI